ncbi:hypothetical protein V6N13_059204 [Hibiscus sabdariffa]|uniref:Uncharacterized protein n=1 Tax=Hibiscus sabdariffa TaxID=183260 RepID=A0ABR2GDR5_9ROSI
MDAKGTTIHMQSFSFGARPRECRKDGFPALRYFNLNSHLFMVMLSARLIFVTDGASDEIDDSDGRWKHHNPHVKNCLWKFGQKKGRKNDTLLR